MATAAAVLEYPNANGDLRACPDPQTKVTTPADALVLAPTLCLKSDVAPWTLTERGKQQKCRFMLRKETKVFYTCGLHDPRSEVRLNPASNTIGFYAEETNCLGYALGRPNNGKPYVDFQLSKSAYRLQAFVIADFLKEKMKKGSRQLNIKLANTGSFFLPFGASVEPGYVAIDMWEGMKGGWHATRRARLGGKVIIVSKDGRNSPVENFATDESLWTNENVGYRKEPAYTLLVPEPFIGNWALLSNVFE